MENSAQGRPIVVVDSRAPNIIVRILWFLFIGWWLGQIVLLLAWISNVTILLLPLGIYLLNKLPQVFTLRMVKHRLATDSSADMMVVRKVAPEQHSFWIRALYFIVIGWWFSLVWLELAWLLGVIVIGLPISFWMFGRAAIVTTLERMG